MDKLTVIGPEVEDWWSPKAREAQRIAVEKRQNHLMETNQQFRAGVLTLRWRRKYPEGQVVRFDDMG